VVEKAVRVIVLMSLQTRLFVLIVLDTRLVTLAVPAFTASVLSSVLLIVEFPFILRVLIAGLNDQSAIDEMLDVVARGIPFSSSALPADVRTLPSRTILRVLILEQATSSNSPTTDDMNPVLI
jgi:hypothetical protein